MPLLAAVHGNAVGIGTTMLLHCDLVVAEEGTRFSLPFVDLGLVPEAASSLLLPRLAGRRRAARHLLLGEPFGPDEALAMGSSATAPKPVDWSSAPTPIAAALLAKPPEALRLTQRLLRQACAARKSSSGWSWRSRLSASGCPRQEVKEAITAFFARAGTARLEAEVDPLGAVERDRRAVEEQMKLGVTV